jgi:hypothetical protein
MITLQTRRLTLRSLDLDNMAALLAKTDSMCFISAFFLASKLRISAKFTKKHHEGITSQSAVILRNQRTIERLMRVLCAGRRWR